MFWFFELIVNLASSLTSKLNKIICMCFYLCKSCDFLLLLAKSLCDCMYVYPYLLVFLFLVHSFRSLSHVVTLHRSTITSGHEDLTSTLSLVLCAVLWRIVRHLLYGVRCERGMQSLKSPGSVASRGGGTPSLGSGIASVHCHPLQARPHSQATCYVVFFFQCCIASHHKLRGLRPYPFLIS